MVPFIFDTERVNSQSIAARDVDEFHIEIIMSHRGPFTNKKALEFKVNWSDYDASYDTWEPCKNLRNTEKLHEYLRLINLPNEIPSEHHSKLDLK